MGSQCRRGPRPAKRAGGKPVPQGIGREMEGEGEGWQEE